MKTLRFVAIVVAALGCGLIVQGLCLASGQDMAQAGGSGTAAFLAAGILLCQARQ